MSHPSLRTVSPHPYLPLYIKDLLKEDMVGLLAAGCLQGWLLLMTLLPIAAEAT
jgi:hypothetical protein